MRHLIVATGFVLMVIPAVAQEMPKSFIIPAATMNHVVQFLRSGGTYAEATALADQLVELAQEQMAREQKAPPDSSKPP
jgi:hypothetical protein